MGGGEKVQLSPEDRNDKIVSCAVSLGLFMILKVVLVLYLWEGGSQQVLLLLVLKTCSGQARRSNLTGALKGNVSRRYFILS